MPIDDRAVDHGADAHRDELTLGAGRDEGIVLKSLIMRLRRKVGRETIVNGYGLGYRLRTEAEPGAT